MVLAAGRVEKKLENNDEEDQKWQGRRGKLWSKQNENEMSKQNENEIERYEMTEYAINALTDSITLLIWE